MIPRVIPWILASLWTLFDPPGRAVDRFERRTKLTRIASANRAVRLHRHSSTYPQCRLITSPRFRQDAPPRISIRVHDDSISFGISHLILHDTLFPSYDEYFLLSILDFLQFSLLKSVLSYPQFSIPSQFQFSILDSTQFSILALFGFQFFSILRLSRKYLQKFPPINYIAPRYFASAWDPRSSRDSFDSRVKSCFTENRTSYETVVPAFAEQMVRGNTVYALDRERVPQVRQLPTFLPSSLSGRSVLTY